VKNLQILIIVAGACLLGASAVPEVGAQTPERQAWLDAYKNLGVGATMTFPFKEFGDTYNTGYGLHVLADYPVIPLLNFSANAGWTHFGRANEGDGIDVFSLVFGGKVVFGPVFMGGETGYYSKVEEWSWVPSFGVRHRNLEFSLRYKATGAGTWTTLRAGYYF
jgi:hypothetical protein